MNLPIFRGKIVVGPLMKQGQPSTLTSKTEHPYLCCIFGKTIASIIKCNSSGSVPLTVWEWFDLLKVQFFLFSSGTYWDKKGGGGVSHLRFQSWWLLLLPQRGNHNCVPDNKFIFYIMGYTEKLMPLPLLVQKGCTHFEGQIKWKTIFYQMDFFLHYLNINWKNKKKTCEKEVMKGLLSFSVCALCSLKFIFKNFRQQLPPWNGPGVWVVCVIWKQ